MALWLKEGSDNDIVVSTRARLARNVEGIPFPYTEAGKQKLNDIMEPAVSTFVDGSDFSLIKIRDLSRIESEKLIENHLISRDLLKNDAGAIIISPDESLSIMLMEEDSYRIQSLISGLDTDRALSLVNEMSDMLGKKVRYAFDPELGFLTGCITNVGTGLRISVMLHLPALTASGRMSMLISQAAKLGLTVRGIYGEGSTALGNIYQISNQKTLGLDEVEITKSVTNAVKSLIDMERSTRDHMIKKDRNKYVDTIWRSLGLLKYSKMTDLKESLKLLSDINIGKAEGLITGISHSEIYNAMISVMPANIWEKQSTSEQLMVKRAGILREIFKKTEVQEV